MISKVNAGNALVNNYKVSNDQEKRQIQNKNLKSKEESRLESIKKSIENGSYKIDLDKTANKIADTLI